MTSIRYGLTALLLCCAFIAKAQNPNAAPLSINDPGLSLEDVLSQMYSNTPVNDSVEGGTLKKLRFLETFWRPRATVNDSSGPNMFAKYYNALRVDMMAKQGQTCTGNWRCIGPDSLPLQYMGKVDALWVDPVDSNYILAGTLGGLFKTTDGGANWVNITHKAPIAAGISGISWIAVNPLNKQTIYLGTMGEGAFFGQQRNGAGMLKSFDGGQNWQQEFIDAAGDGMDIYDSIAMIQKVYFRPDTTRLYAFCGDRVFTRTNSGSPGTWVNITPYPTNSDSRKWFDLEFDPADQNHFFIANMGVEAGIWESTVAEPTPWYMWNDAITTNLSPTLYPPPSHGPILNGNYDDTITIPHDSFTRFEISIPASGELYTIGMCSGELGRYYTGLFFYDFNALTPVWAVLHGNRALPFDINNHHPASTRMELAVSSATTTNNLGRKNIYYGSDVPFHSFNGGDSFVQIGRYYPDMFRPTHADIRAIVLQKATGTLRGTGDRVYFGTDGGVSKKVPGVDDSLRKDTSTIDISGTGLTCGHFWSISTSEAGGLALGASQHNGALSYEPTLNPKWRAVSRGDMMSTMIDQTDPEKGYMLRDNKAFQFTTPFGNRQMFGFTDDTIAFPNENSHLSPPLFANDINNQYAGLQNTWWRPGSGNWNTLGSGLPTSSKTVTAVAASRHLTDFTGYALCDGGGSAALYHNNGNGTFVLRTSVPHQQYPTACVTLDGANPNRVWIGKGGISSDQADTRRVHYSPNGGVSWYDVSKGLPRHVPVSKIIYQEGCNVLYCATDVGIYRCDFSSFNANAVTNNVNTSVQWECFSKGQTGGEDFPNGYVTELKINYCESKLYAATYGRSIWATDITVPGDHLDVTKEVTANQTWNSSKYLTGSIRIKPDVTLTITGANTVVQMPKGAYIYVDAGAKLIVDSATITNKCEGCQWGGIRLGGDISKTQETVGPGSGNFQGVAIFDDAKIEHAVIAVENFNGSSVTGGRVAAYNTLFLNNGRSVYLHDYLYNPVASKIYSNKSTFSGCTFLRTTGSKKSADGDKPHVDLKAVKGVSFGNCQFYNRQGSLSGHGNGIQSTNATVTVKNSTFKKFINGIYSNYTLDIDLGPSSVMYSVFDSCTYGVRTLGGYHLLVANDSFKVGRGLETVIGDVGCYVNVGVFASTTQFPYIEENYFEGFKHGGQQPEHQNFGVLMENTGDQDKWVYRCKFNKLDKGIVGWGVNKFAQGYPKSGAVDWGLRIYCNEFRDDTMDVYVGGNGIAFRQGSSCIQYGLGISCKSAGNTFLGNSKWHLYNDGEKLDYYFDNGSNKEPANNKVHSKFVYTSGTVEKISGYITHGCPSYYGGGDIGFTSTTMNTLKANFYDAAAAKQGLLDDYAGLIDGGNTVSLLAYIESTPAPGQTALYNMLIGYSPYLTEEVIRSAANSGILSDAQLMDVLGANPEMVHGDMLNYFESSIPDPLSAPQIADLLLAIEDSVTIRTDYESQLSVLNSETITLANLIVGEMHWDTLQNDADSIPVWYDHMNTIDAEYAKIAFYTTRGDYTTASDLIENMPIKFEFTVADQAEFDNYVTTWNLLKTVKDEGRTLAELETEEVTVLEGIADEGPLHAIAAATAEAALETLAGNMGANCIPRVRNVLTTTPMKPFPGEDIYPPRGTTRRISDVQRVQVVPNPASDFVLFKYNFGAAQPTRTDLTVTDMLGTLVLKRHFEAPTGVYTWDAKSIPSGIYLYKFTTGSSKVHVGKIVITK